MPRIGQTSTKPSADGDGKHKPRSGVAQHFAAKRKSGTDDIEISALLPGEEIEPIQSATMNDAAVLIAGIRFLLRGWIAFGMLTGIVAEPGIGKSAFVLFALVRVVVTACDWFNGLKGPSQPGCVLWCGTENDMAITLQRMRDWNIPMDRIVLPFADDPLTTINLTNAEHLNRIEQLVRRYQIKLVIVDSLRGGHGDDENNSRVGRVLQDLAGIAERTNAAIIVVHHTKKLMVDEEITANSSRGSNAILAMMRSQIGIDKPDPKSKWCRVRVLKENLGIAPNPVGFQVTATGLEFGPPPEKPRNKTEKDRASDWLKAHMKPGKWYSAAKLEDEAGQDGYSETALRRARVELGIAKPDHLKKTKDGWEWMLPGESKASGKTPGKTATP
ncbi:MAG: AAA family ATPase [Planctomycetaceae bacterium]|nr:AAA family ATPase [Planctomycetaceae bacterium]